MMLATNLEYDTEGFLTRLVDSWGEEGGASPSAFKLVVTGGCDPSVG